MPSWEEPYITFHIVWHPLCPESSAAAVHLREHLTRPRFAIEEMGVSVFEWSTPPHGSSVPAQVALGTGAADVVVVLIGDEVEQDAAWSSYVIELAGRCRSAGDGAAFSRLFPVAMTSDGLATRLGVQALPWYRWQTDRNSRARRLVREITYEASRMLRTMLGDEPDLACQMEQVRVFLSHSKHDAVGERVARRIRKWLQDDVQLSPFLDIANIPAGLPSDEVLEEGVRQSAVLIVYSDSFSSREWCRREVLVAKASDRPIVVADCIEDLDERAFPYLANVPVVRLRSGQPHGIERVIGRLLDEVFKDFLWQCRTVTLRRANPQVMFVVRPPELLTLINAKKNLPKKSVLVYPDPPLGTRELDVLDGVGPSVECMSEWMRRDRDEE